MKNPYELDIDFAALALQDPDFNKILKHNGQLDFSNPQAVKQLTKSLLKRDFNIEIDLPDDRLCPPVPNRLNYILWLQSLLDCTNTEYKNDIYDQDREVWGMDIGTGASCIYPLLGCNLRPRWKMAATDVDDNNLTSAIENIHRNGVANRIRTFRTTPDGSLIALKEVSLRSLDFTMCNPPFYASNAELLASAAAKSRPPRSACTGAEVEMVTPGGEVAFVSRMVDESVTLKTRVQWYTSMLGKLSSVSEIVEKLKRVGIDNWAVTEFVQGQKTRRWAVAWSWGPMRPRQDIARNITSLPKHLLPFPCAQQFTVSARMDVSPAQQVRRILASLDLRWWFKCDMCPMFLAYAKRNVWSRAARRAREKANNDQNVKRHTSSEKDNSSEDEDSASDPEQGDYKDGGEEDDDDPALGIIIRFEDSSEKDEGYTVHLRWLRGNDSVLFESFCGMLKRQMTT